MKMLLMILILMVIYLKIFEHILLFVPRPRATLCKGKANTCLSVSVLALFNLYLFNKLHYLSSSPFAGLASNYWPGLVIVVASCHLVITKTTVEQFVNIPLHQVTYPLTIQQLH